MNKKQYANFYTDRKFKSINHNLTEVYDENNYLFAKGIYKTKILEKELPEYFVKLYLSIKYVFVSVKNIKDIKYKPNYSTNHLYKDDLLYISYDKPIIKTEIIVKENKIGIIRVGNVNYISLTDLAKYQNSSDPSFTVKNWLRRVTTIDYRFMGTNK